MKAPAKTFGSPEGEPNTTTNSPTPQQMCEKLWTLPLRTSVKGKIKKNASPTTRLFLPLL